MRITRHFFLLLAALTFLAAMAGGAEARTVTDQVGRVREIPDQAQRIVALAPNITEIIFALGGQDRLVGTTQYSNFPEAARSLPVIGSYIRPDLEKILALRPDLCLAIRDGNPRHAVERLEQLHVPVVVINPAGFEGIMAAVRIIATAIDLTAAGERITAAMAEGLTTVTAKTLAPEVERPRVFFQIDATPIISAGRDTFIDELITRAGGHNLAGSSPSYPRYSWEEILAKAPEVVIITSMAGGHGQEELKKAWRQWPQIPAVKNNRLHVVDADLIDRPTPRTAGSLALFARIIHPELFPEETTGP